MTQVMGQPPQMHNIFWSTSNPLPTFQFPNLYLFQTSVSRPPGPKYSHDCVYLSVVHLVEFFPLLFFGGGGGGGDLAGVPARKRQHWDDKNG